MENVFQKINKKIIKFGTLFFLGKKLFEKLTFDRLFLLWKKILGKSTIDKSFVFGKLFGKPKFNRPFVLEKNSLKYLCFVHKKILFEKFTFDRHFVLKNKILKKLFETSMFRS